MGPQHNAQDAAAGLDLVALRYATQINGLTAIALTKLDVFDTLEELQVCVAYRYKGKQTTSFPSSLQVLEECEPVYETLPGWQQALTKARTAADIPQRTKDYIAYVADYLDVPIPIISVGPDRGSDRATRISPLVDRSISRWRGL